MKKNQIVTLLLLLTATSVWAGPIGKDAAFDKAKAFINGSSANGARKAPGINRQATLTPVIENKDYYVFNVGDNEGFVIASGSDKTQEILGYSDTGRIDPQNMPEPLKAWFAKLPEAVSYVEGLPQRQSSSQSLRPGMKKAQSKTKYAIPTLINSRWNQSDPYNLRTPSYKDDQGVTHSHSATGCVATAMAQVMYFWKWPQEACKDIPAYSNRQALPATTFKWDDMTDTYNSASTTAAKNAVAELMVYVGYAVQMGYGASSGAWAGNPPIKLREIFDYDPNLFWADHNQYTFQEWEDLIYHELAEGRPVLISGDTSDLTGGHEWVCDGYDGNGCFHQNWGWGGLADGYFVMTVMQPDNQGIGGSTSADGFSMSHTIVVGCQPNGYAEPKPDKQVKVTTGYLYINNDNGVVTRRSESQSFRMPFTFHIMNWCNRSYSFDYAFALYDEQGNYVKNVFELPNFTLNYLTPRGGNANATFTDVPDGVYYMHPVSRQNGSDEWIEDDNAASCTVKFVVDGNTLTAEGVPFAGRKLTLNELELVGPSVIGQKQKVRANITNNNGSKYYANTFLIVDNQWVSGNCISIEPGETIDTYFQYTPTSTGNHNFIVSSSKNATSQNDIIGQKTINIEESEQATISVSGSVLNNVDNSTGSKYVYGNTVRVRATLRNNGEVPYVGKLSSSSWRNVGNGWVQTQSKTNQVSVEPKGSASVIFLFEDLENGLYDFHVDTDISGKSANLTSYNIAEGIVYWTADGNRDGVRRNNGLEITDDIVAVQVPGTTTLPTITFAETYNPNVTLYLEEGVSIPSRLKTMLQQRVKNWVYSGHSESIEIDDNYPVAFPVSIDADKVTYTRQIAEGEKWSTLVLPFAAQTATIDGTDADWFRSDADTDKQFVVKELVNVNAGKLYFDYADELYANRPYLVSFEGEANGTAYKATGKTLVISATETNVMTNNATSYTTNYTFFGSSTGTEKTQAYVLADTFDSFVSQTDVATLPHRAVFTPNNSNAAALDKLIIVGNEDPTSITPVWQQTTDGNIYNMQGQRVDKADRPGIYIINGKKVAVK